MTGKPWFSDKRASSNDNFLKHSSHFFFQILRCFFHAFILFQQIPVQDVWAVGAMFWLNQNFTEKIIDLPGWTESLKTWHLWSLTRLQRDGVKQGKSWRRKVTQEFFSLKIRNNETFPVLTWKRSALMKSLRFDESRQVPRFTGVISPSTYWIEDYIGVKHNPLATCPQVMIQSWFRLVWKLLEAYIHIYIHSCICMIKVTRDHQIPFFLLFSFVQFLG